ncbi:MAG: hypothetical protein KIT02_00880 [Devosia sp.]|uniref:hypothetical protein n=1 Tax=Devosia sp. TaxID=1871048 RepID=UPI0024C9E233|nr:hypothetical protein [Devosia sp.]UYN99829.1 MAG: hypothetical protein KIT02_00880 [Devosia sp.]
MLKSRNVWVRLAMGAVGALLALLIIKVVDARGAPSAERMDEIVQGSVPEVFGLFKTAFPAEYDTYLAELVSGPQDSASIAATTTRHLVSLRQTNAHLIQRADDNILRQVIAGNLQTLRLLHSIGAQDACNRYALGGATALTAAELDRFGDLHTASIRDVMRAIASGRADGIKRKLAQDADWDGLMSAMGEAGHGAPSLTALAQMDGADPHLCAATIGMLEAMLSSTDAAMGRVRASFVADLARM